MQSYRAGATLMKAKYLKLAALLLAVAALGAAGGYWWAGHETAPEAQPETGRKVLYWYDPMVPQHRFEKPGKSPFMDMQLVPKYADEGGDTTVKIDPAQAQNLGVRVAIVTRAPLANVIEAAGVLSFNERDVAVIQARTDGFVERVYARAPGDIVRAGSPLADLLVPAWAAAQTEFLALRANGDAGLRAAARERLRLTGMPQNLIERVERSGRPHAILTVAAPIGGVIQQLDVRAGMSVTAGQTLARINGLNIVWLDVAVPEAQAGAVRVGQSARASFAAFPGEAVAGRVTAILPEANPATRTLRVRVELPNRDLRLKPGMTAQVRLESQGSQSALRVPTEAVIRTGKRALVMIAEDAGRYRPVEVSLGHEVGGDTAILAGLEEGQRVVVSGQFLIDSEASLRGMTTAPASPAMTQPQLHESQGEIRELSPGEIKLSHGPISTLAMPSMTMAFPVARPELTQNLQPGDRVRFALRESDSGLVIERIEKLAAKP